MADDMKAQPFSDPGAHEIAIGEKHNRFLYDVDSEGNVLNFRGADEPDGKDATKEV